ncbi:hypothetical protein PoB_001168000 [Plakobranchus ocellatus]|uniref:Uncharacterized protein n=1 Tax=Plakobranchus ocellatus TaxID=259542 RepID=A0AAV3YPW0_9GAST|nr:hypothetical protein PoB_001168000 [Plakobranchus ocellatus]
MFRWKSVLVSNTIITSSSDGEPSPQKGDLRLLGPPSGQGAGSGAQIRGKRVPVDLRADSLTTVPQTPPTVTALVIVQYSIDVQDITKNFIKYVN